MKLYIEHLSDNIKDGKWYLLESIQSPATRAQHFADVYERRCKLVSDDDIVGVIFNPIGEI